MRLVETKDAIIQFFEWDCCSLFIDDFPGLQFVFCRDCLQGYHIDECQTGTDNAFGSLAPTGTYVVDAERAAQVNLFTEERLISTKNYFTYLEINPELFSMRNS